MVGSAGRTTRLVRGTTICRGPSKAVRAAASPATTEGFVDEIGTESVPAAGSTLPPVATNVPETVFTARLTDTRPSAGVGPPAALKTRRAGFPSGSGDGVKSYAEPRASGSPDTAGVSATVTGAAKAPAGTLRVIRPSSDRTEPPCGPIVADDGMFTGSGMIGVTTGSPDALSIDESKTKIGGQPGGEEVEI